MPGENFTAQSFSSFNKLPISQTCPVQSRLRDTRSTWKNAMAEAKEAKTLSENIDAELRRAGKDISVARKMIHRISQGELATRAGIGLSTVVAIEKGECTVQLGHWLAVMDVLGLTQGIPAFARAVDHPGMAELVREVAPKRPLRSAFRFGNEA